MRYFVWLFFLIAGPGQSWAQSAADTLHPPVTDTAATRRDSLPAAIYTDSVSKKPVTDTSWQLQVNGIPPSQLLTGEALLRNKWFILSGDAIRLHKEYRQYQGKDLIFYMLLSLCIVFAVLRQAFPKYFSDLFRLFFRTTLKQRQIREQLMQTPLPSLLLNGFYVVTGGLYLDFIYQRFHPGPPFHFWLLFLYAGLALSAIYFIKFTGLKLSGWIFNMEEAASAYVFIVFVVNKMIGIFLLPVVICLAFMKEPGYSAVLVLSWCGVGSLLLYRLVLTFSAIRNQVRLNPFHFFLYLCAFEVAPVLLIYKGLLVFFGQTA